MPLFLFHHKDTEGTENKKSSTDYADASKFFTAQQSQICENRRNLRITAFSDVSVCEINADN